MISFVWRWTFLLKLNPLWRFHWNVFQWHHRIEVVCKRIMNWCNSQNGSHFLHKFENQLFCYCCCCYASLVEGLEISKSKNAFGKWECSMIPLISWDKIKWEKSSFNTKCFTDRIRTNTNSVIFFEDKWWHLLLLYLFSRRLNCFWKI